MPTDVLSCLVAAHNQIWQSGSGVGEQTKKAIVITKEWQRRVLELDSQRYVAEFKVTAERNAVSHKIDVVDTKTKVAYELKVSPNNPHFELYKDIFKVALANQEGAGIVKLVFCCTTAAQKKLGYLGDFVKSQTTKLGFELEIYSF
jgi:hypothetical protein